MTDDATHRLSTEGADPLLLAGVADANLLELQRSLGVRVGFRGDIRVMWSWIPGDDYGYWCDFYGCFVVQETETVAQGLLSGGLIFHF